MLTNKFARHTRNLQNHCVQVIEYVLGVNRHGPLQSSSLQQFVESVGSRTSTPGGGSVAGLVTVLGLALGKCVLEDEYSGGRISGGACNRTRSSVR